MTPLHHAATAAPAVLDSLPDQTHAHVARDLRRALEVSPAEPVARDVPFFNRQAVEREIHRLENPAAGTLHLNDGKERPALPGGTLRRMLAIIDELAAAPQPQPQPQRVPLTLPPLPDGEYRNAWGDWPGAYTDEQMTTYARACAAAWGVTLTDTED